MQSLLDQVNILIKMKVGDAYRLEHIKLMLKQKRTVYGSDRVYLDHLIDEYVEQIKTQKQLSKIHDKDPLEEDSEQIDSEKNNESEEDENDEDESEDKIIELEHIYCWKCGKSIPVNSKFCLDCGSDIKKPEVKEEPVEEISDKITEETVENKSNVGNKKNIFIVIGVLAILAVIGGAVVMEGTFDKTISSIDDKEALSKETTSSITPISQCGAGTIFDEKLSMCVVKVITTHPKCGPGVLFDEENRKCIAP
jgi:hypothetical protein